MSRRQGTASWMGQTFSSLRIRNFRLFFVGQLVSNSGNWLTTIALTLLVLARGGNGIAVGALAACQYGPILLFSAWGGVFADRFDKRHLLYLTQGMEMAESVALAVLAFNRQSPLIAFYATAVAGGFFLAFDNPVRRSFVNEMVPSGEIPNAVTLYSAIVALSRIVGPLLAGALVVTVGYGWCFTVDAASYLVVLAALVMMRPEELHRIAHVGRMRGQVRSGLRYVVSVPELWITFAMLLLVGLLSYNFTVVFPLFVEHGLGGNDVDYTFVYAGYSVGGVAGTLLVARRRSVSLRSNIGAAAGLGVAMLALGVVPGVAWALPAAVAVGVFSVSYNTANSALAQLRADRAMIGRVVSLQTVLQIGTTPLGGPLLGYVADVAGARMPVFIGSAAALAAAVFGLVAARRHAPPRRPALPGRGLGGAESPGS